MKKLLLGIMTVTIMSAGVAVAAPAGGIISADDAQAAALASAKGKILKLELDDKKYGLAYEVKIFDGMAVTKVDVNAVNGTVMSLKRDTANYEELAAFNAAVITQDQALKTATAKMPGAALKKVELKAYSGNPVYKIELLDDMGRRHDAFVNAIDGNMIELRQDKFFFATPTVTRAQAEETAAANSGGTVLYAELKEEKNSLFYKVKVLTPYNSILEARVDAISGYYAQPMRGH